MSKNLSKIKEDRCAPPLPPQVRILIKLLEKDGRGSPGVRISEPMLISLAILYLEYSDPEETENIDKSFTKPVSTLGNSKTHSVSTNQFSFNCCAFIV